MNLEDRLPQNYKGFLYRKSNNAFILNSNDLEKAKQIMLQDNLNHLEINPNHFRINDLSFLKEFSFITEFSILGLDIIDIKEIENLTNLRKLYIAHKFKGNIDFTKFKHLEECVFTWGIKGSESIYDTIFLKKLTIYSYSNIDFSKFEKQTKLEELELLNSKINNLNGIEKIKGLKRLSIIGAKNIDNLNGIENLDKLEFLEIDRCKKINDLSLLCKLSNLKKIHANDGLQINDLNFIINLENLEEFLFAGDSKILNNDLSPLEYAFNNKKLKRIIFMDRKSYSHKRNQLGY
jgi:hypothetical protein